MKNKETLITYKVIYSQRRTLGLCIKADGSLIIRVPAGTSDRVIKRLLEEKKNWILKHTIRIAEQVQVATRTFTNGEMHLFRGQYRTLTIIDSDKQFCRFADTSIEVGTTSKNKDHIRKILYAGYRNEAMNIFPGMLKNLLEKMELKGFKPAGLKIRTMKSRWGSCSSKGFITLNSDLVRLNDIYIEYVMMHELCHLKHHNHGNGFYVLLSELCPDWKRLRRELKGFTLR